MRIIAFLGADYRILGAHCSAHSPTLRYAKNDANDAAAICAAAQRPDMRFVRLRSQRQSDVQSLHRLREGLVKEKTASVNRIRSLLGENGIVVKQGAANVYTLLPEIADDESNELSPMMRRMLRSHYVHLLHLGKQIEELEAILKGLVAEEEEYKRLMQIPGVGLMTATLLGSEIGNGAAFCKGRSFAAYLGLVPRQYSSGGKNTLRGISKQGNRYLRTLLIHCARTVLRIVVLGKDPFGNGTEWIKKLLERRGHNKTVVAVAAKLARIAWAMMSRGTNFQKAACTA